MGFARAGEGICVLAIRILNGWPNGGRSGIQGENDLADMAAGLHQRMGGGSFGKGESLEDQRLDLARLQQRPNPLVERLSDLTLFSDRTRPEGGAGQGQSVD